ncbi:MAG: polyribonucleotide nucleotidyltransferase [Mollicutes bacterium]|nr:polyribonucleotide nucleotidyltransferase [Mollicutes bacterium]MDY2724359.1 polyribonucleotide nucleotidyltransferase [Candidatus Onthovivens sp.]MDY4822750.1 polyribonucleotide nucleotidyltransferase [Candidatus Onthovivens sp.]
MKRVFEKEFFGKKLIVETGEIAKQADGACFVRFDDTVVLSTVCCSDEPKEGDFFPLTVTYEEKQYAVGRIPGGFLRREGRPGEHATLTARLIDRPIRPMFSDGFRNEVQIINTVMSVDLDATPEMTAMFGSSLALCISDIPFDGPIAGVYVGRVNGEFIINPTVEQRAISDLNLAVAGTKDAINMVEAGANELSEDVMLDAIMFAHEAIKQLCDFEIEIAKEIGKEKRVVSLYAPDETIVNDIYSRIGEKMVKAISIFDKLERQDAIDTLKNEILDDYDQRQYKDEKDHKLTMLMVNDILEGMVAKEVRRLITEEKIRPDGRKIDEIRPLDAQVDLLPRVHGSAMFTRGQTQVISTCTLGIKDDEQILESLSPEDSKRWMHHYNFPPFSVGEIGKTGTPGRREIGHGALGERALSYVLPSEEEFPYTIRCVAEVVESNGSSSQASICASCMALMAAGVPIRRMVSGIAMGLITSGPLDGKHPYTILTDIQGLEDHFGDMDFKVAGTEVGVTALQMDIKIKGVTREILHDALMQAHKARAEIREVMSKAISEPRKELSKYAPKFETFYIKKEKIKDVIGSGGKVINDIIEKCDNVKIDIDDDGKVVLYHTSREVLDKTKGMIDNIVREVEIGEEFDGVITRVEDYGGFVKLFGDKEGLLHISRFSNDYVKNAADVMHVGDTIKVKVIEIDDKGKIKLSHKEFTKPAKKEAEKKLEAKKEFKKEPFKGVADDDGFVEVKKEEPKAEVKEEKKKFSFFKKK